MEIPLDSRIRATDMWASLEISQTRCTACVYMITFCMGDRILVVCEFYTLFSMYPWWCNILILKAIFMFKSLYPFLLPTILAAGRNPLRSPSGNRGRKRLKNQSIGSEFLGRLLWIYNRNHGLESQGFQLEMSNVWEEKKMPSFFPKSRSWPQISKTRSINPNAQECVKA